MREKINNLEPLALWLSIEEDKENPSTPKSNLTPKKKMEKKRKLKYLSVG